MENIESSNPYIRNGRSCHCFRSAIQISIDWSFLKLPALAAVVAEVLTLQAYSPGRHHDYVIDLATAEIRRSRLNRRKFVIKTGSRAFNIFCSNIEDANVWASVLAHSSSRCFGDFYTLGQQIAEGRHSKVYFAHAKNDSVSTKYVVKVNNRVAECNGYLNRSQFERDAHTELIADFDVSRKSCPTENKIDLEERKHRELKLKLSLDKIVILRDSFGTPTKDFLVFQYQDGETLSKSISRDGPLSERNARIVMWDLFTALHFMHEQGVVHRDVSASNVFYWDRCGKVWAKLFDLSEARQIRDGISGEESFRDSPGKLQYKALEILLGRYHGKPSDIWACGVLLYRMLSGVFPFEGETEHELRENIKYKVLSRSLFAAPIWNSISSEAILLIKQVLQPDPFKRPSALGARSHKWFGNEFRLAPADVSRCENRFHVPQRIQTPVWNKMRLQNRALSTSNPEVLPAPFPALCRCVIERTGEKLVEDEDLLWPGNNICEVVHFYRENPPPQELKGDRDSDSSSVGTTPSSSECDWSERMSSSNLESPGGSNVSFVTSLTSTLRLDRWRKMAAALSQKLSILQANLRIFPKPFEPESEYSTDTSSYVDLESPPPEPDIVPSERSLIVEHRAVVLKLRPDRKRRFVAQESPSIQMRRPSLTHRCNHLCSLRPCTRSTFKARADKLLRSHSRSKLERSVATSTSVKTSGPTPDLALCVRQHQREDASSEIVPITRFVDNEVFQWARKTKLFSDVSLERAPVDPLFFSTGPSSMAREVRKNELLAKLACAWQKPSPQVLLRDEMCVGTHIMKSVVALAHVGLPQFFMSRPLAAKLILGSPTAQLQLSMILPYRRKFRTAGMALMAMFRMISLKKGTCLTRRISRGQALPIELSRLVMDIRRKCHMRPLRARMPRLLPPDELVHGSVCRKERVDPRPNIEVTPQTFWSRQFEVKKGIVTNAVKSMKQAMISFSHALMNTESLDVADEYDTDTSYTDTSDTDTCDTYESDTGENDGDRSNSDRSDGDRNDVGENEKKGSEVCNKSISSQEITPNEVDDFNYALNVV